MGPNTRSEVRSPVETTSGGGRSTDMGEGDASTRAEKSETTEAKGTGTLALEAESSGSEEFEVIASLGQVFQVISVTRIRALESPSQDPNTMTHSESAAVLEPVAFTVPL